MPIWTKISWMFSTPYWVQATKNWQFWSQKESVLLLSRFTLCRRRCVYSNTNIPIKVSRWLFLPSVCVRQHLSWLYNLNIIVTHTQQVHKWQKEKRKMFLDSELIVFNRWGAESAEHFYCVTDTFSSISPYNSFWSAHVHLFSNTNVRQCWGYV